MRQLKLSEIEDRVVVTGAGGLLAGAFRRLLPRAHFFTRAELDVAADKNVTFDILTRIQPALVLNCAAFTKVDLAEENEQLATMVNGSGAGGLALACNSFGSMLVHFSTDYVFDGTLRRPLKPDDSIGPQSAYGRSKRFGEQLIQDEARIPWLIIRTAWLYGPGGPNFVQTMLNLARAGKPLRVVDDQIGAPTFTHDLAEATLRLIDHDARGIWHVTNAGQTSWFGFAQAIFEEFGLTPDLQPTTSAEWKKLKPNSATRPAYSVLDLEPYAKLTGTPMRHWREALREYHRVIEATPSNASNP
jgi:dTDP-4-dehydrorhamnose reductase